MLIFAGEGSSHLVKYFVGNGLVPLHKESHSIRIGQLDLSRFANGENRVLIKDGCENEEVIIFQNFCAPVDQNIIQFCLMVDAIKRQNPKSIKAMIPWLGYAKQDKVFRSGEPLAAEVIAKIISSLPIDKLFLLDIHHPKIKNFFTIPVEEFSASDIFIKSAADYRLPTTDSCIVSPDFGALERNKYIADRLKLSLSQIDKERDLVSGQVKIKGIKQLSDPLHSTNYVLRTSSIFMFDDMILSGGTVVKDAEFLESQGADKIYFFATHLDPTTETFENLAKSTVEKIFVTNSLHFEIPPDLTEKVIKINIADFLLKNILK